MTVYIAGGITGVEDYKARFAAAKRMLLREGEDRPISMEHYYGTPRVDKVLNPAELPEGWPGKVYMDVCLAMIRAAERAHHSSASIGCRSHAVSAFGSGFSDHPRSHG